MGFLEERDFTDVPSIPEYYKGKTIFLTGGSGFMGKVLIEKLLYSCTDLDRIYILVRNKKGVKAEERLDALYSSLCFDRLRKEKPGVFEKKVFVIAGDVIELGLGLSDEDRALIINRTNIIFHVAASVRFDDTLSYAAKLNLRGTKEVLELAKEVRDLEAFIHVSTSYSNTNREVIEEVMYPPLADWRETLKVVEELDENSIKMLTPKYIGELPNTYVFTKQLAEHAVYEEKGKLPIVIIRPSIVISSMSEPLPGWIENFNGPAGMLVACGKGIMRSIYSDPDLISDYIPVDLSIRSIIAAGWGRGTKKFEATDDIEIYNNCASKLTHITMGELVDIGKRLAYTHPLDDMLWNIGGSITRSKYIHFLKVIFYHLLPAILVDSILWIAGKKPLLVKIQRRIYIANLALGYYITRQWTFDNKNFIDLRSKIKEVDREGFYYDIEGLDVVDYFRTCCIGGRRYLLKEKDENLPRARAHLNRMIILEKITQCIFYSLLAYWFFNIEIVRNLLSSIARFHS